jgi:hypothetical protein
MYGYLKLLVERATNDLAGTPAYPAYYLRRLYPTLVKTQTIKSLCECINQALQALGPKAATVRTVLTELLSRNRTVHGAKSRLTSILLRTNYLGALIPEPWGVVVADHAAAIGSTLAEDISDSHTFQPWQIDLVNAARRANIHVKIISNFNSLSEASEQPPTGPDERPILFGRFEMMENVITGPSGEAEEHELKQRHPEVEPVKFRKGINPDLLIAMDQHSKLWGMGSHNCVTCQHFHANQQCPAWAARDRDVTLDQNTVYRLSVGGCRIHDMVPGLSEGRDPKHPSMPPSTNAVYDEIVEKVLDEDFFAVYRNGNYRLLTAQDLGIDDPRRRSREFDDYMGGHEQEWDTGSTWRDAELEDDELEDDGLEENDLIG